MKSWQGILLVMAIIAIGIGGIFLLRQVAQVPRAQVQELTVEAIKNAVYYHEGCNVYIRLEDGANEQIPSQCKGETLPGLLFRIYNEKIAFGDLTNDGSVDAAVVVTTNYGGSGNIRELVVQVNTQGVSTYATSYVLGDRVVVNDISIQNSSIVLDMVTHGPDDGACCPTQKVRNIFQFDTEQNKLIKL